MIKEKLERMSGSENIHHDFVRQSRTLETGDLTVAKIIPALGCLVSIPSKFEVETLVMIACSPSKV